MFGTSPKSQPPLSHAHSPLPLFSLYPPPTVLTVRSIPKMHRTPSDAYLRSQEATGSFSSQDSPTTSTSSSPIPRRNSRGPTNVFMDSASSIARRSAGSEKSLLDAHNFYDSPYGDRKSVNSMSHVSDKYSFAADPNQWGANLSPDLVEEDDYLHTPENRSKLKADKQIFTWRGIENVGCLVVLLVALVGLFAGYPIISHFTSSPLSKLGGFNIGGINASGQISTMGNFALIDIDTPKEAYTKTSWWDNTEMELVFSDEFNTEGRSFYPGDDPYWEAADMHYWSTNDMEWYDPAAVTTVNGALQITMSQKNTHDLNYQSGHMTSWNKFCFTGGYIEVNVSLPGLTDVTGFWPSVWTMGNLGRAGYGASLEGMWPYTYDACDVGTAPNQTINGQPTLATVDGDPSANGALSFLPGQRLSRCTCPGESHPGPMHSDGTYVGRSAPEIDIFEAQITNNVGQVSQSAQWAPFNYAYEWFNTSDNLIIANPSISELNTYTGGAFQQASSVVTNTNQGCYTNETSCFSIYGFEYQPGFDNAYITWISDNKVTWTAMAAGFAADERVNISARPIPQEPMYIIMQFGMSTNFATVDLEHLPFPSTMLVDYVRVYQKKGQKNIGCDPEDFPTADYINTYLEAYTNPNLTTWVDDFKQKIPRSSLLDGCD
ncbi:beta-glucan synthesis-associated [Fomitiporia mediterranea MF3/22]|uniref:beta-glucan synthesis-associated n=1 Tax=Fomitiporia mediterranea (strain MF3/22) TaxID=694068 RepID=UPI0004408343|nr:beta-glucan synthesis-associated [Fomitiporia mediterranea MF3/22]EJD00931.1 beta-glucan synthesis-associated [Fomitiporia mediterranea MF3/22]